MVEWLDYGWINIWIVGRMRGWMDESGNDLQNQN